MKKSLWIMLVVILAFAAIPAAAQFGSIKKIVKDKTKTEKPKTNNDSANSSTPNETSSTMPGESSAKNLPNDPEYFYVGADKMEGTEIGGLKVCSDNHKGQINWKNEFKQWFDEISQTAQLKMFEMNRCELMGFHIINKPGRRYRKVDDLKERAEGLSVYQVEAGELVLVKDFQAPALYVVVVPEVAKPGLKLADLNLCVKPEQKDHYRRKAKGVSNCHDLKQMLYALDQYKKYPGEYQTNSALFFEKDFQTLNKQGKFKSYKVYKLVVGNLKEM